MRLIDADEVMRALNVFKGEPQFLYGIASAKEIVEYAPTIDAELVRHGRWIRDGVFNDCSVCGIDGHPTFKYCPHCGAKNG